MTLPASLLRDMETQIPSVDYLAERSCQQAKVLENKGNYEDAWRALGAYCPRFRERPQLTGLAPVVAAEVLLRIGLLTDNSDYQRRAATILRVMATPIQRYPAGFGRLLCALDFYLAAPKEIAVIGEPGTPQMSSLLAEIWATYLPNRVVALGVPGDQAAAALVPLLRDRKPVENQPTAFVCEHFTCKQPVTAPADLAAQLTQRAANTG